MVWLVVECVIKFYLLIKHVIWCEEDDGDEKVGNLWCFDLGNGCIIWVNGVLSRNGIDRKETNGNGVVFVSWTWYLMCDLVQRLYPWWFWYGRWSALCLVNLQLLEFSYWGHLLILIQGEHVELLWTLVNNLIFVLLLVMANGLSSIPLDHYKP